MGGQQGYSKIATSGLVFAYDTGDTVNSYKGKPTTNLLLGIEYTYGTQNQTYFKSSYGTETSYIPGLGGDFVNHYCNFFNDYNGGSGNCCPNPFSFGNFTVAPNTVYTYQIIYRTPDGYANTNYMYHYEYGPGGYVTEYGLWSAGRLEDLGNGWVHAWGTFTSNANTNYFQCYFFHYQYTQTKIQLAGVMLTQGSNIIPPRQFLTPQSSRSNTQGLLDISGTGTSINLANVSFDANTQYYFDGTDDYIDFGTVSAGMGGASQATMELVINMTFPSSLQQLFGFRNDSTFDFFFLVFAGGGSEFRVRNSAGTYYDLNPNLSSYAGKPTHIVFCVGPEGRKVYANGVLIASNATWTGTLGSSAPFNIGRNAGNYWFATGAMPVAKLYTKQLTANEVLGNFNHYKTRFNIT